MGFTAALAILNFIFVIIKTKLLGCKKPNKYDEKYSRKLYLVFKLTKTFLPLQRFLRALESLAEVRLP